MYLGVLKMQLLLDVQVQLFANSLMLCVKLVSYLWVQLVWA